MARRTTSDETKLARILEKMPFDQEKKQDWVSILNTSGLNEEIAHQIQQSLADLEPTEDEQELTRRAGNAAQITLIIRRWRLAQNLPNQGRRR